ncbi:MAG: hypothetical protein HZB53_14010 [Chloroflexi bacterium]|nr:hypothetical protein [Chloroflexota bacterium]
MPRLARIANHLPGWQFEIYPREDEERAQAFGIKAIPTFIVCDGGQQFSLEGVGGRATPLSCRARLRDKHQGASS